MLLLGVALAGVLGAPVRYTLDAFIQSRVRTVFPAGTFVINVTGSFLLGLLTGLALHHGLGSVPKTVVGTGFCGAYTTFSTFSYETFRLVEDGSLVEAALNVLVSMAVGLVAAGFGLWIATVA